MRSYLVGSREFEGLESSSVSSHSVRRPEFAFEEVEEEEVAMTRNVVRSKRMTSVALHAWAKVVRCLARILALGMRVWTIFDQAW